MTIELRIPSALLGGARTDLLRPHRFAHERVGYFAVKPATTTNSDLILYAYKYLAVLDEHYIDDPTVGALIGPDALRAAMQVAYSEQSGLFHTHLHPHKGMPWFGSYDLSQNHQFVPDMFNVAPGMPHGALIFSLDAVAGLCWPRRGEKPVVLSRIVEVGAPLRIWANRR